ncbi:pimeloyl-ACP methyl ester carboxylesterase [Pseudonocardia sediminis]|uniref:Pimeloyl-ACP methyl ester carboxylesterase n=1 Tax=Pseudonocardia sediminis TaxID=1397368 RepID=A0A4Q7UQW9_PSEST|nr:alpha/beta hydrolase [Pseudonocardia sediminis]RZT83404.1 pimeloyl-ACP methyl ester carboxylesterase [Pseudonocardia sediminis]
MRVGHFTSSDGRERFQRDYAAAMALMPAPDAVADANTPFGTVRAYRFGGAVTSGAGDSAGGAPLVLLPGAASPGAVWAPNLAGLAAHRTVYVLDILGGPGASMQRVPIRTTDDQARWLGAALESLDLHDVHLVGTSIGGWLATALAVRDGSRLASVSLFDPAQTLDRIPLPTVLRSVGALPFAPAALRRRFLDALGEPRGARGTSRRHGKADLDDPVARVIDSAMRAWSPALPHPSYPTEAELARIGVPVLVVLAGTSVMLDAERARQRAERAIPDVRVEVWAQASHALTGEFPDAVAGAVLAQADAADARRATR